MGEESLMSLIMVIVKLIPQEGSDECPDVPGPVPSPDPGPNPGPGPDHLTQPNPNGACFKAGNGVKHPMPHYTESDNRTWCVNKCRGHNYAGATRTTCTCMSKYNEDKSGAKCNRQCMDFTQREFCGGRKAMN